MAIQRYSFGTQKPDRDSEGDFVKYEDIKPSPVGDVAKAVGAWLETNPDETQKRAMLMAIAEEFGLRLPPGIVRLLTLADAQGEDLSFEERDGVWTLTAGQLGFGEGESTWDAVADWERRFPAGKTTDAQRVELLNHEQPEGPSWNNQ
jgi:hypothetical protein